MHPALEEKLRLETRICPRCRYKITNPFFTRCPRCSELVPTEEPGCISCLHRKGCPAISLSSNNPK